MSTISSLRAIVREIVGHIGSTWSRDYTDDEMRISFKSGLVSIFVSLGHSQRSTILLLLIYLY